MPSRRQWAARARAGLLGAVTQPRQRRLARTTRRTALRTTRRAALRTTRRAALRTTRTVVFAVAALAVLTGLAGCAGDPDPDPATAPLELVLEQCTLNRPSVAAGPHTMAVVGKGRATVTDPQGAVVLTAPGGEEQPAEVQLAAGTYGVTCEPEGGGLGEAELEVSAG